MSSVDRIRTAERLHRAALHLLRDLRRVDAAMGIGPAQASALSVLVFGGPRSLGELARAEQVSAPTMSRVVAGLEEAGLVSRRPDPADRRRVILRPTARGRRRMEAGRKRRLDLLAGRLESLAAEEVRLLDRAAEVLGRVATDG